MEDVQQLRQKMAENYWVDKLKGITTPDTWYEAERQQGQASMEIAFPQDLYTYAAERCQQKDINLFKVFLAAYFILLHKYAQTEDIFTATPLLRLDEVPEPQQGQLLYFRSNITSDVTIKQLLDDLHQQLEEGWLHRDYTYRHLSEKCKAAGNGNLEAIGYSLFSFDRFNHPHTSGQHFPLHFSIITEGAEPMLVLNYDQWHFSADFATQFCRHYFYLLRQLLASSRETAGNLQLHSPEEQQVLLQRMSGPVIAWPQPMLLHRLLEQQAVENADRIALVTAAGQYSYGEMNEAANRRARFLLENYPALQADDVIAVVLPKSASYIFWMLAVLKAGAAFLPIDPRHPAQRRSYMLKDSGAKAMITTPGDDTVNDHSGCPVFYADDERIASFAGDDPAVNSSPSDLAYIIYTSGSTGKPKGVMVEHRNIVNTILSGINVYGYTEEDRILQFASTIFDVSVADIFTAFSAGARLLLLENEYQHDISYLAAYMKREGATAISINPHLLPLLNTAELQLRMINTGGENPDPVRAAMISRSSRYYNSYGPTEAAVCCAAFEVAAHPLRKYLPVGQAFANTQLLILDEAGNLLPDGITGEICIAGAGLTRGYVNNAALTAEKFLPHPFNAAEKMYRTGDYGKYLSDGNLLFISRRDQQAKVAGHRIELAEIEHAIRNSCSPEHLHVTVRKDTNQHAHIVVYYVYPSALEESLFEASLRSQLPAYMMPSFYVHVTHFPVTANGKLDVAALPDPFALQGQLQYTAPVTPTEQRLASVWASLLKKEQVGRTHNFFRMGGNSILATQLLAIVQKEFSSSIDFGVFFKEATIASLANHIDISRQDVPYESVQAVPPQPYYELSYAQQRLWVICQFEKDAIAYNMPMAFMFHGNFHREAFLKAIAVLMQRHESLRTIFELVDGAPMQKILPEIALPFEAADLRNFSAEGRQQEMNRIFKEEAHRPFDLEKGPLLRFIFLWLDDLNYCIIFNIHHIVNDGWSYNIIMREATLLYNSFLHELPVTLPPVKLQYKDYAQWHRNNVTNGIYNASEQYWLEKFRDKPNGINLPLDYPRQVVQTFNGGRLPFRLPAAAVAMIRNICDEAGCTFFIGLLTLVKLVLHHYSRQQDIIVGAPIAGRRHPELHDMIGFLVNTLVYRTQITPTDTFRQLLGKVGVDAVESYTHQDYPFDLLIEKLNLTRDLSQSPLFNVMLAHNNTETEKAPPMEGLATGYAGIEEEFGIAKFDLLFFLDDNDGVIDGELEYNTDLFKRSTAQRILQNFIQIVEAVAAAPDAPIQALDFIRKEERATLEKFAFPATARIKHETIHAYFEEQAALHPHRDAVFYNGKRTTYGELNAKANQLARYLGDNGVKRKDVVGICLQRSPEMLIAILGTVKAGAAYLAVDPAYPVHRVAYMLSDSQVALVISDGPYEELFEDYRGRRINLPEDTMPLLAAYDSSNVSTGNTPEDIAYIIYTSGSTGTPNGAMLSHGILSNLVDWQLHHAGIDNNARCLQFTSINFCVSFQEIFITLAAGGEIYLIGELERKDIHYLSLFLEENRIENLYLPFSYLNFLLQEDHSWNETKLSIKHIITAGEQLKISRGLKAFLDKHPEVKLHNHYGSSEMHVVTAYTLDAASMDDYIIPPAGAPLTNTRIIILDEDNNVLPLGVFGEIHVQSGYPVSGYINNNTLNQKKFIRVPGYQGVFYRTGDMGRWLDSGMIELQGRKDSQLKIRGFRVEIGEVESRILSYKGVDETVVVVKKDKQQQDFLVAYVVMSAGTAVALKHFLQDYLPNYMVPQIMLLPVLPLMPNGKVDRQQLPDIPDDWQSLAFKAPETALQQLICDIWKEVLHKDKLSINDNFFDIGGQSLKATQVISRIFRKLQVKLDLRDMFINPTIEGLTFIIAEKMAVAENGTPLTATTLIPVSPLQESYPLSNGQARMWVTHNMFPGNYSYNILQSYNYHGYIDIDVLQNALRLMTEQYEILRTAFPLIDDTPRQVVLPVNAIDIPLQYHNIKASRGQAAYMDDLLGLRGTHVFNLAAPPLMLVDLVAVTDNDYILLINVHHIIADEWSLDLFIQELKAHYAALLTDPAHKATVLSLQYKDYAVWQQEQLSGGAIASMRDYWLSQFRDEIPVLDLSTDLLRNSAVATGASITCTLSPVVTNLVRGLAATGNGSPFMTLLALINVLLYKYTSQQQIVIGTPSHGREHPELENQFGFFVNTLPLVTIIDEAKPFSYLLAYTRELVLRSYENQFYPFDQLINDLQITREAGRNPLFDIMVTYYQVEVNSQQGKAGEFEFNNLSSASSKFDLTFAIVDNTDSLQLTIEYNTGLFYAERITRMVQHLEQLAHAITTAPLSSLSNLDILSKEEVALLNQFNDTTVTWSGADTLAGMWEEQQLKTPEQTAVVFDNTTLTYRELEERSAKLAAYLRSKGVGEGAMVPLIVDRSLEMIIGVLGILKAGAAYVPVDPAYPAERIAFILEDTGAQLLLTTSTQIIPDTIQIPVLRLDAYDSEIMTVKPPATVLPHYPAYVIYTSGSTGTPKGAINEHGGVVNRLKWMQAYFELNSTDAVLQKTTYCFDVSVWELLWPLVTGAKLVFALPGKHNDPVYIREAIQQHHITTIHFVPAVLAVYLQHITTLELSSLRRVICSGEALQAEEVSSFHRKLPAVELYNLYGPTEAAIDVTCWHAARSVAATDYIPIGKPISNVRLHILDIHGNPVPVGVAGELHIAGIQVARGYLNRAELTKEKFITALTGERIYRTGDLAAWQPDGNIIYKGRIDDQVKVRGYRIEPGEITAVILRSGLVKQAIVVVKAGASKGDGQLAGYLVATPDFQKETLVNYLRMHLPEYMVPMIWITLDALPLTPNGKVDKRRLPSPEYQNRQVYIAPRTATEAQLAIYWQEALEVEEVSTGDNFFELGGHSLRAVKILNRITQQYGITVTLRDMFAYTTIAGLAAFIDNNRNAANTLMPLQVAPVAPHYPLSSGQARMWVTQNMVENNNSYNILQSYHCHGKLDIPVLQQAMNLLVHQYEILRTCFDVVDGTPRQFVLPASACILPVHYHDLRGNTDAAAAMNVILETAGAHVFDLSKAPLLYAEVVQLDEAAYQLMVNVHHIITDEWSMDLFIRMLKEYYAALMSGLKPEVPLSRIQYKDYAVWQQQSLHSEAVAGMKNFWMDQFREEVPALSLPADFPRGNGPDFSGNALSFTVPAALSSSLRALTAANEGSVFMTMLTLVNILLYRYTDQRRMVIGTPSLGREHPDLENQLGFFVNTLPLVMTTDGETSFHEQLRHTKELVLSSYEHQFYPFDELVNDLHVVREANRNPLFDVMVTYYHTGAMENTDDAGAEKDIELTESPSSTSKFDLTFIIIDNGGSLQVTIEYNTDLFRAERIRRMAAHLECLFSAAVTAPNSRIRDLRMLGEAEETLLLHTFNNTSIANPPAGNIVTLFQEQARLTPDHTALIFESERITYRELDERSNRLAHYLIAAGLREENLAGIFMGRTPDMIVAILGILKSGAAYVPLDPAYPADRIRYMLEDTNAMMVLTDSRHKALAENAGKPLLVIDELLWNEYPATAVAAVSSPGQLAYVIYTSGSTGRPKGVMVTHGNAYNFICWSRREFAASRFDIVYAATSICFDLSVFECWYPLTIGKTIRLLENALSVVKFIATDNNVLLNTVPGVVNTLLGIAIDWSRVSVLNMAGEQVPLNIQQALDATGMEVRNLYGPTETTTYSTCYRLQQDAPLTVGTPIDNTQIYITDSNGNLMPVGIPGEICIGGQGVTRGYLHQPDLSAEKYVPCSFAGASSLLMYRTGDIGCWLPDGNIDCRGRKDDQVKIRGYRIETGEIENAVLESGCAKQVVIVAKENPGKSDRHLVGYVVPGLPLDRKELTAYLHTRLPEYMIPAVWVEMEAFPLNSNGKIDKRRLPEPRLTGGKRKHEPPRNNTEEKVVIHWREVLGVTDFGIYDNFFELGGHSLSAVKVLSRLKEEFQVAISLRDIFTYTTLADLAGFIDSSKQTSWGAVTAIPLAPEAAHYPLSSVQARMWVTHHMFTGNTGYNIIQSYLSRGHLDVAVLRQSLDLLVARYEILRTRFDLVEGVPRQFVLPAAPDLIPLRCHDLRGDTLLAAKEAERIQKETEHYEFDLSLAPPVRIELMQLEEDQCHLLVNMHHIITDEWSLDVFLRMLRENYLALMAGAEPNPVIPRIQYKDYAVWQQQSFISEAGERMRAFWREQFRDDVPVLSLPADFARSKTPDFSGNSLSYTLDPALNNYLRELTTASEGSLFMTLLTLVNVLLYRYTGQHRMVIGTPSLGREHPELENQLGCFVNTLPLLMNVDEANTFHTQLQHTRELVLRCYENQFYPFDELLNDLHVTREANRNPLFDVMVAYYHRPASASRTAVSDVEPADSPSSTSKFDLTFSVLDDGHSLQLTIEYNTGLFRPERIRRMAMHLECLLSSAAQSPYSPIRDLQLLAEAEEGMLLHSFNNNNIFHLPADSIVAVFEQQVRQTPDHPAIVYEGAVVTYRELEAQSNRLAHYLLGMGVQPEQMIPVCADKSPEMITGILAILKAGAAYVPVDPDSPVERMQFILKDIQANILLTSSHRRIRFDAYTQLHLILLDTIGETITALPATFSAAGLLGPNQLACLIYTSGTTGVPKGVMIEHRSLVNTICYESTLLEFGPQDSTIFFTSLAFDVSLLEIGMPLVNGGTIVIPQPGIYPDTNLLELISREKVTVLQVTPSMLTSLLATIVAPAVTTLRAICVGGESLHKELVKKVKTLLPGVKLHNHYGPTEATIDAVIGVDISDFPRNIIGKPVGNMKVYILDAGGRHAPVGIAGEIYLSGPGVARGYLHQPELTAEKFVTDPFSTEPGMRMYRTGDRGTWLPDGTIEYLGRTDRQLKHRGYRIEPEEVEHIILQSGMVREAMVMLTPGIAGKEQQLTAYVVAIQPIDKQVLTAFMRNWLPEYAIPAVWIQLDAFPLNSNGKTDRQRLPLTRLADNPEVNASPRNSVEENLLTYWKEVLELTEIGIYDNFFELGGHSLKAVKILNRVELQYPVPLELRDVFNYPTIAEFAGFIERSTQALSQ